jgi:hypothetical protein
VAVIYHVPATLGPAARTFVIFALSAIGGAAFLIGRAHARRRRERRSAPPPP